MLVPAKEPLEQMGFTPEGEEAGILIHQLL